tara:strand:+ start:419 stop:631 length:213 start_codon:yes stop_codon:yes gene_type:complete
VVAVEEHGVMVLQDVMKVLAVEEEEVIQVERLNVQLPIREAVEELEVVDLLALVLRQTVVELLVERVVKV